MDISDKRVNEILGRLRSFTPREKELNKIRLLIAQIRTTLDAETPEGYIEAGLLVRLTVEALRQLSPSQTTTPE